MFRSGQITACIYAYNIPSPFIFFFDFDEAMKDFI